MSTTTKNFPKVGTAVCVIKDGKVLLGKRIGKHAGGTYSFPGGHLEMFEGVVDCIKRELLEETNLVAKNFDFWTVTNDFYPEEGRHYVTLVYVADYVSGELKTMEPEKCEGWNWYSWNDLPKPLMPPIQNMINRKLNPFEIDIITLCDKE